MIEDDRGRVPFAIVGVLLLVASATIAATSGPAAPASDPAVESALDRTTATVNSEVRGAIRTAAEDAAGAPVIVPANTSIGAALNDSRPFRDALRLRIYLQARERLADVDRRRGDVRVTASLPPTPNRSAAKRAIDRVDLHSANANDTAITVRVRNVTMTVQRHNRTVTTRTVSPTLTVATPVLEMHERVSTYEERLNAPVTEPGLSQRMNAQLMAVAWARGWGQNMGAPIDNVVATRHVSLAANAGTLDVQRTTIGHVDSDGLRALRNDTVATAGQDLLAGLNTPPGMGQVTGEAANRLRRPSSDSVEVFDPPETPRRNDTMTIGVNRSADDAFLVYEERGLEDTIAAVYGARVRPVVRVSDERGGPPGQPAPPGPEYRHVSESVDSTVSTHAVNATDLPEANGPWERVDAFAREVTIEHERRVVWSNGTGTTETSTTSTERATVTVQIEMRLGDDDAWPFGTVEDLYEPGAGPLGGSNLEGMPDRAREAVLNEWGGRDGIAEAAAAGDPDWSSIYVAGDPPDGIREYVMADVNRFRERLRNESVTVERGAVASYSVDPHARLAERLDENESALVDPPARFDSVADRARIAARASYLQYTVDALRARSDESQRQESEVNDTIADEGSGNVTTLQQGMRATPSNRGARYPTLHGPSGPVRLRVDSAPSYLPANAELDASEYPALENDTYAMTTRNVNVFGIPYGEATDGITGGALDGPARSRLDTAARTLHAANGTLNRTSPANLTRQRNRLRADVKLRVDALEADLARTLDEEGVGDSGLERLRIVEDGLDRWSTLPDKALALANGSAARPIASEAAARSNLTDYETDHLRLVLADRLRTAVGKDWARPVRTRVNETAGVTRAVASDIVDEAAGRVVERAGERAVAAATNESVSQLPAGLPLVPAPGFWYATTNAWTVTVRGEYARFGVRATSADPTAPGGEIAYVRDGSNVTLDVDGDGREEVLGRSTRVDFEAHAYLAVVVPPNPRGVGDTDGVRNETSAGWPRPGPN